MSALTKDRLIFDPANMTEGDQVGSYLIGASGTVIGNVSDALKVNLTNASIAVTATALDIRPLTFATDKVDVSGSSVGISGTVAVTQSGTWNVNLTDDSIADNSADSGNPFKVGSRSYFGSALAAISSSGNRADLLSDKYRRIFINDAPSVAAASVAVSVDNVAEVALPASPLSGRTKMIIQNLGAHDIYIGPTGVTTSSGLRVANGATLTLEIGDAVILYAISGSAVASNVRVMQLG